jgi:hypothetical protein
MVEFLGDPTWTIAGQGRKINLDLITVTITVVCDALGFPDRNISADLSA